MQYTPPPGSQDPNAKYITGVPGQKKGSPVPAEAVENPQREIVNVIQQAGLEPSNEDLTQLYQAVQALITLKVKTATTDTLGVVKPDNITIKVTSDGTLEVDFSKIAKPYELGEYYFFRNPTLRDGFRPCYGAVVEDAATRYPKAWEYLQTVDGQQLLKTESEWQAMSTVDPWNGIGGVPFMVQDLGSGSLRLPDIRGMYMESVGFDSLNVGGVKEPGLPNITGRIGYRGVTGQSVPTQAFYLGDSSSGNYNLATTGSVDAHFVTLDASRSSTVYGASTTVRPRSFGVLPCVYLGS